MIEKFISSAVRQVGRDLGKVVSNQVFKDAHSTPIRHVNRLSSAPMPVVGTKTSDLRRKTDFEKSMNFKLTFTPPTLINKLVGAFMEFKKESDTLLDDEYLSFSEASYFISMLNDFSNKTAEVAEVVEMHPKTKDEDLAYLNRIANDLKRHIIKVAEMAIEGSMTESNRLEHRLSKIDIQKTASRNLIWAGLFVSSVVAGYFIWKGWVLYPIIIFGLILWDHNKRMRNQKQEIDLLEDRKRTESQIRNIMSDLLHSESLIVLEK